MKQFPGEKIPFFRRGMGIEMRDRKCYSSPLAEWIGQPTQSLQEDLADVIRASEWSKPYSIQVEVEK